MCIVHLVTRRAGVHCTHHQTHDHHLSIVSVFLSSEHTTLSSVNIKNIFEKKKHVVDEPQRMVDFCADDSHAQQHTTRKHIVVCCVTWCNSTNNTQTTECNSEALHSAAGAMCDVRTASSCDPIWGTTHLALTHCAMAHGHTTRHMCIMCTS